MFDACMFDIQYTWADVHVCVCETVGSVMINVFFYAVFQTILLEDTHTDQFVSTHPFTTKHIVRLEKIFSIIIWPIMLNWSMTIKENTRKRILLFENAGVPLFSGGPRKAINSQTECTVCCHRSILHLKTMQYPSKPQAQTHCLPSSPPTGTTRSSEASRTSCWRNSAMSRTVQDLCLQCQHGSPTDPNSFTFTSLSANIARCALKLNEIASCDTFLLQVQDK